MNIMASYNWIREYCKTDMKPEDFAARTTAVGNSVERIHNLKERFDKMVVGHVVKIKKHPNADRLSVVETKIGAKAVEIVCGGTNVREGMRVAVALPGAKVYWHGKEELSAEGGPASGGEELKELEVRGVKSHGMICAPSELGFAKLLQNPPLPPLSTRGGSAFGGGKGGDPDRMIWDLTDLTDAKPGTTLAKALDLDDVYFDIEVTSNRPDCKSIIGQAREGAVATGGKFAFNALLGSRRLQPAHERTLKGAATNLFVRVEDPILCSMYSTIVIEGVKVAPSPWWMQKRLLLAGHRPINNVVDVTNYVLHEYGQPLHAFDADKLVAGSRTLQGALEIIVRKAKKGEQITALDGKQYTLDASMLVIADSKHPVAIAGVMGGMETGTTQTTKRVVIESATFDPVSVRRTSHALGLTSESSLLFDKGLSTESTLPALARAVELICELTGGHVASSVVTKRARSYKPLSFPFDPDWTRKLIGKDLSDKEMLGILLKLGFVPLKPLTAPTSPKPLRLTVPPWRDHDIEDSVDFVEEVARVHGYANIPGLLPAGAPPLLSEDPALVWERRAKEILKGAGLTETYAHSFVSAKQLERWGLPLKEAVHLTNPLSVEEEYLRSSLIPTMLTTIEQNQRLFSFGALFELAPVWQWQKKGELPTQKMSLLLAVYGNDGKEVFVKAKGIVERLAKESGLGKLNVVASKTTGPHWHPARYGRLETQQKVAVGMIGQVAASAAEAFGLEPAVVLVEINFEALVPSFSSRKGYTPIPVFPEVKRDLAFVLEERHTYTDIKHEMLKASPLLRSIELFDVYEGASIGEGKKSLAFHLTFGVSDRTLSSQEAETELGKIRARLESAFHAIIRA